MFCMNFVSRLHANFRRSGEFTAKLKLKSSCLDFLPRLFGPVQANFFQPLDLCDVRVMDRNLHGPELERVNLLANQLQPGRQFLVCFQPALRFAAALITAHNLLNDVTRISLFSTMSIDI